MTAPEGSKPHLFMQEELERALSEQSFGITSYEILQSSQLKATSSVLLLESDTVLVTLTGKGFQIESPAEKSSESDLESGIAFETLEQLLQSLSPMYEAARRSVLIAKLSTLTDDV